MPQRTSQAPALAAEERREVMQHTRVVTRSPSDSIHSECAHTHSQSTQMNGAPGVTWLELHLAGGISTDGWRRCFPISFKNTMDGCSSPYRYEANEEIVLSEKIKAQNPSARYN